MAKSKKPDMQQITRALALTQIAARPADPITACNVCGQPDRLLDLYRECDVHDDPRPGPDARLYVGATHESCRETIRNHPRLYIEDTGGPGTFPALCGACLHREGTRCAAPDGADLRIELERYRGLPDVVCMKGAPASAPYAVTCSGRTIAPPTGGESPGEHKENANG